MYSYIKYRKKEIQTKVKYRKQNLVALRHMHIHIYTQKRKRVYTKCAEY